MPEILEAHGFSLGLDPEAGGETLWLDWNGLAILRRAPPGRHDIREGAAFPMVPFAGRIEEGAFSFEGRTVQLPANLPPEPHAIHGQGWQLPWEVSARSADSITISLKHEGDIWPWAYSAMQTFSLTPESMTVTLAITNASGRAMPAGLGWHPYCARAGAEFSVPVSGIWPGGSAADQLCPVSGLSDLNQLRPVGALVLDNAFSGKAGAARILWREAGLALSIVPGPELTHWIVYIPEGCDFFCVEPVSHAPNALNIGNADQGARMETLQPGETFSASCRLVPELGSRLIKSTRRLLPQGILH